ncbi:hypothetical protein RhiirA4_447655 [Rhizophagus irregularis]|uniref:Uncharacterized protein n=1 Tax=Rhizophagus irregularis TaxID=588596 RepID=A0A2I1H3U7_9GLOM|nr:hypothetical protein RhiirA4_447655 [Rhizophagus irregularis]
MVLKDEPVRIMNLLRIQFIMIGVKSPPLTDQPPPSNPEQSSTLTDQPPLSRSIQPPTYEEATSGKSYCRRKHLHDNVSSAIAFNTKIYSKYRNNQIYWEELNRA